MLYIKAFAAGQTWQTPLLLAGSLSIIAVYDCVRRTLP